MPFLTRIYNPTQFGELAVFISLTLVLSEVVTGKFELAVLLPKNNKEAIELAQATIKFCLLSSTFTLFIIFILKEKILALFNIQESIGNWIYFIPIVIFFNGLYEVYKDYALRTQSFNQISNSFIERALSGNISQLILGLLKVSFNGLILGKVISCIIANIEVSINYLKQKKKAIIGNLGYKKAYYILKDYKDFLLFSMPSSVLTTFSFQLIVLMLPVLFTNTIAGFYLLAQRILNIPISIVGNSMRQVYFKDFSVINEDTSSLKIKSSELFKKLLIIGTFPTCIIIAAGPFLFSFIFGREWNTAGIYAQILSPWYLLLFITGPISSLLIVLRKQKQALIFQVVSIIFKLVLILIAFACNFSVIRTLYLFSILSSALLIYYLFYILRVINLNFKRIIPFIVLVIITGTAITFAVNQLLHYFLRK